MTLTSAACPLTEMIEEQVSAALVGEAGLVTDFRINWVWLPPWGPEKITEDGREQMRALGFNAGSRCAPLGSISELLAKYEPHAWGGTVTVPT